MNSWGVRPPLCPKAKRPINLLHSMFIHMYFNVTAHFCANALNTETLSKPYIDYFKQAIEDRERNCDFEGTSSVNCFTLVKWAILIRRSSILFLFFLHFCINGYVSLLWLENKTKREVWDPHPLREELIKALVINSCKVNLSLPGGHSTASVELCSNYSGWKVVVCGLQCAQ